MKYHYVIHKAIDLEGFTREAEAGLCPRHGFAMLEKRLDAIVHKPGSDPINSIDRLLSKIHGRPEVWAMARALRKQFAPEDVVFCSGEDVGLPIAAICGGHRDSPKIAMYAHNVNRPRARLLLKWLGLVRRINLFFTNNKSQIAFLHDYLGLPESKVHLMSEQTDVKFFTPGPASPDKVRPIVASVGLEQRDYRTLAEATKDLDVDVRISGASPDAAMQARAFPEQMPANMTRKFYEWRELVQLYRDADVVAVSLFPCKYAAGITTLLEASACRRPLVITRTEGLVDYLDPESLLITETANPAELREAILKVLNDPQLAATLADRRYEIALQKHDSDRFIEEIAGCLEELADRELSGSPGH
jgi:glycosyltransferase involved in cell wall biosynthesis